MATNAASEVLAAEARPLAAVAHERTEGAAPTAAPVHEADRGKDKAELGGDGAEEGRLTKTGLGALTRDPLKPRDQLTAKDLRQAIKKQVEYYLSDNNLMTDAFFHGKIQEAEKKGKGVSLNLYYILTSPRIKALKATRHEILESLAESAEVSVVYEEGGDIWISRRRPLPAMKKRRELTKEQKRDQNGMVKDLHAVGCLLRLSNLPEVAPTWDSVKDVVTLRSVKDAIREKLPKRTRIRYVSRVDDQRQCTVWLGSFKGDKVAFKEPVKVQVGGAEATLTLMDDNEVRECCNSELPRQIRMTREKELQKYCSQLPWLPLSLGGTAFNSVHHLKQHVADLLDRAEAGKLLKPSSAAEKVVMALLEYHPNAFMKKGGTNKNLVGFKVDLHEKANKAGERTKGVFAVRRHNQTQEEDVEEFSLAKCILELSRDPPVPPEVFAAYMEKRYATAIPAACRCHWCCGGQGAAQQRERNGRVQRHRLPLLGKFQQGMQMGNV